MLHPTVAALTRSTHPHLEKVPNVSSLSIQTHLVRVVSTTLARTHTPFHLGIHLHPWILHRTPQGHARPPANTIRVALVRCVSLQRCSALHGRRNWQRDTRRGMCDAHYLIASLGLVRMKRTEYGWEEKESSLEFYEGKEQKRA